MISRRDTLAGLVLLPAIGGATTAYSEQQTAQAGPATVPLPEGTRPRLEAPGPSVPREFAAFAGKWGGKWDAVLASNLYVESVAADGAALCLYVWDNAPNYNPMRGAARANARIAKGLLTWGTGTKFEFRVLPDGTLQGKRFVNGMNYGNVVMTKMAA